MRIIDVIKHRDAYGFESTYVVLDEKPHLIYERDGNRLIGHDEGFFYCLGYEHDPHAKAFAGSVFSVDMKDGSKHECRGDWWHCALPEPLRSLTVHVGAASLVELKKCYVFSGYEMDKAMLDDWLSTNTPATDYHKYEDKPARIGT